MEEHIGVRIRKKREELGISQEELARRVGYSGRSSVNKVEMGANDISRSKVVAFAQALQTTPAYLMDGSSIELSKDEKIYISVDIEYIKVPLYSSICCGNGKFVEEYANEYIAVPSHGLNKHLQYFCQYASGDSMIDAGIEDGDLIIFEKTSYIDDGKIGCFCVDRGEATCKKIKKGSTYIQLLPANHKYDPIIIDLNDNNFCVVGVLKKCIKNY